METERRAKWAIALILAAFFMLSLAYSVVNPLHEATDELRHYRFVRHIVERQALPVQGDVGCSAQGHHPPLYYALAAAATAWVETGRDICYEPPRNPFWAYRYWDIGADNKNQYLHLPDENFPWAGEALAAHLARAVNVLIGAGTVLLTWLIGRAIWPKRPFLAVGGAAIVAFNPMFLYMAGAINNDVIAAFAGAAVTLGCVRLLRDPHGLRPRWGFVLGALYALALLSKFNLAAIGLTIAFSVTWVAWRRRQWKEWLVVGVLSLFVAALLAGWWFARNQMLYGEPTGFQRLTELWGVRDPAESWGVALYELPYVWTSLWGRFGYGQIPLPQPVYDLLWWTAVFALAGLLLPLLRRQWVELRDIGAGLLVLILNVVLFFGVIFNYLLVSPAGPMGRFFFPALPSLALLLFYGLTRWPTLFGKRQQTANERPAGIVLSVLVSLGLFVLALVALFGFLQPAFARPQQLAADTAVPNKSNVRFDNFIELLGYNVSAGSLQPSGFVDVDLFWEVTAKPPGDYLLFVHLIDEAGTLAAQRDTHPGLGHFPSSQWEAGNRFKETVRLYLPETAYVPAEAALSVGFYAPGEGYRLAVTDSDGRLLGDAFPLGQISLEPGGVEQIIPNPQTLNFEDKIRLAGYAYNERLLMPGDVLGLTLFWEALQDAPGDYYVQIRLLNEAGQVVQTRESVPGDGRLPTTAWFAGDLVEDTQNLFVPPDLPAGPYQIQIALEETGSEKRLNLVAEDGHWLDDRVLLAGVRVQNDK